MYASHYFLVSVISSLHLLYSDAWHCHYHPDHYHFTRHHISGFHQAPEPDSGGHWSLVRGSPGWPALGGHGGPLCQQVWSQQSSCDCLFLISFFQQHRLCSRRGPLDCCPRGLGQGHRGGVWGNYKSKWLINTHYYNVALLYRLRCMLRMLLSTPSSIITSMTWRYSACPALCLSWPPCVCLLPRSKHRVTTPS